MRYLLVIALVVPMLLFSGDLPPLFHYQPCNPPPGYIGCV